MPGTAAKAVSGHCRFLMAAALIIVRLGLMADYR